MIRQYRILERVTSILKAHARTNVLFGRGISCRWTVYSHSLIILEYTIAVKGQVN